MAPIKNHLKRTGKQKNEIGETHVAESRQDVFIGLGSNLDVPHLQIKKALRSLSSCRFVSLLDYSALYITAPMGLDEQPHFINAVAKIKTRLKPHVLLRLLQSIENNQHRKRSSNQNAPRTLDLDILIYGRLMCSTQSLVLPHPRMHKRRFVLDPLLEIAPGCVIPDLGYAVQFYSQVSDQRCQRWQRILL